MAGRGVVGRVNSSHRGRCLWIRVQVEAVVTGEDLAAVLVAFAVLQESLVRALKVVAGDTMVLLHLLLRRGEVLYQAPFDSRRLVESLLRFCCCVEIALNYVDLKS